MAEDPETLRTGGGDKQTLSQIPSHGKQQVEKQGEIGGHDIPGVPLYGL